MSISGDEISLKVARSSVTLQGFESSLLKEVRTIIGIGQHGMISKSPAWKKMQDTELTKILTEQTKAETKAFKAKRKAEHIDKILSSLSDKEEREAHARLNKSLEDTEILPGETEEMMAQKFQKKLSIYNRASKSNDFYEDDITALIQDLSDSIETFETCYPNSEFVARYRKRIKEIVASKQSKDKKERIYVVIFIIILVVSTIYYYYTDITNFFKNLL